MSPHTRYYVDMVGGGLLLVILKPLVIAAGFFRCDHNLDIRSNILVTKLPGGGS